MWWFIACSHSFAWCRTVWRCLWFSQIPLSCWCPDYATTIFYPWRGFLQAEQGFNIAKIHPPLVQNCICFQCKNLKKFWHIGLYNREFERLSVLIYIRMPGNEETTANQGEDATSLFPYEISEKDHAGVPALLLSHAMIMAYVSSCNGLVTCSLWQR